MYCHDIPFDLVEPMLSSFRKQENEITGILVGDELGQVKRIDMSSGKIRTINKHLIDDRPAPDKPILSIRPFHEIPLVPLELDDEPEDDGWMEGRARAAITNADPTVLHLITQKPDQIFVYNSVTDNFIQVRADILCNRNPHSNLVGAAPFQRNNIVVCFDDGNIFMINIEKDLLQDYGSESCKASKLLGLNASCFNEDVPPGASQPDNEQTDLKTSGDPVDTDNKAAKESEKEKKKEKEKQKKKSRKERKEEAMYKSNPSFDYNPVTQVFKSKWSNDRVVTCFEVSYGRLAIAGKNVDLRVFDLRTKECIFAAKQSQSSWGKKKSVSIADVAWLGPVTSRCSKGMLSSSKIQPSELPSLVATCSKVDAIIKIYDIRGKKTKPIWILNFKEERLPNDVVPPSFTCMTASVSPITCAVPTQQLFLGTTMGRMIATELRFNSHSHRQLGLFKGFSGGTVRDIGFVANVGKLTCHRVISCSLDRFVRVHSFRTGSDPKRRLESKFYIKTRPTCVQPIISTGIFIDLDIISEFHDFHIIDEHDTYAKLVFKKPDEEKAEDAISEECVSGINVADFDEDLVPL